MQREFLLGPIEIVGGTYRNNTTSCASLRISRDPKTVYVNPLFNAYNSSMCIATRSVLAIFLLAAASVSAQGPSSDLTILTKELPPASLWSNYRAGNEFGFHLQAKGGVAPYHWRIAKGALPHGVRLEDDRITGMPDESGNFRFILDVRDSNNPPAEDQKGVVLSIETPFSIEWDRKAQVNGQRIDGSIKVSNRTGRNFDLTFIVLAVNDIGRATAIGYQHFPLRKNTRNLPLPFGDTLSSGDYTVNVDVVAEEPISKRIFRARLVTGKESITQGP